MQGRAGRQSVTKRWDPSGPFGRAIAVAVVAVILVICIAPVAASAPPTNDAGKAVAHKLHTKARAAYAAGKRTRAIELWREAINLQSSWKYAYNMAYALYEEEQYAEAWKWASRLEPLGFPADQPKLLALLARLRVKLSTAFLKTHAWINLEISPKHASVLWNGVPWVAPRGAWTRDATTTIRVEADDFVAQEFVWQHATQHRHERAVTLASIKPGRIHVIGTPVDADVQIDGTLSGKLPQQPRELAPGPHVIRVGKAGFHWDTFKITVRAGQLERITVDLIPKPAKTSVDDRSLYTPAGWSTLGSGVAVLGLGVGLLMWSGNITNDLKSDELSLPSGLPNGSLLTNIEQRVADIEKRDDLKAAGWTLTALGGAAAIAGAVVLIVGELQPGDAPGDGPLVQVVPLRQGAAVMGLLRF